MEPLPLPDGVHVPEEGPEMSVPLPVRHQNRHPEGGIGGRALGCVGATEGDGALARRRGKAAGLI